MYLGTYNVSTWRTKGVDSPSQTIFVIDNPSKDNNISIRWLEVMVEPTSVSTTVSPIVNFSRGIIKGNPGGTLLSISKGLTDYEDATAVCYGSTDSDDGPVTSIRVIPGITAYRYPLPRMHTAVGLIYGHPLVLLNTVNDLPKATEHSRYTLKPGECGIVQLVKIPVPKTTYLIVNCTWEEWGNR